MADTAYFLGWEFEPAEGTRHMTTMVDMGEKGDYDTLQPAVLRMVKTEEYNRNLGHFLRGEMSIYSFAEQAKRQLSHVSPLMKVNYYSASKIGFRPGEWHKCSSVDFIYKGARITVFKLWDPYKKGGGYEVGIKRLVARRWDVTDG